MTAGRAEETAEVLASFTVSSEPGNERVALREVASAAAECGLTDDQLERLKTAVAEATMNAIEHGNGNHAEIPVDITVLRGAGEVAVTITDRGGDRSEHVAREVPDIELKLRGEQRPRGWGLFLVQNMVDEMQVSTDGAFHTVRLTMRTGDSGGNEGDPHGE
jgi:anti-sigma regulatory factor (Ser/Thr protein kinase)